MSKYSNIKTVVDGIKFDSKLEAKRYGELSFLATKGYIERCCRQIKFPLEINGIKVCDYIADFVYWENGKQVVEDCKGFLTPIYRLKKKMMKAQYGIDIVEIRK